MQITIFLAPIFFEKDTKTQAYVLFRIYILIICYFEKKILKTHTKTFS